MSLATVRLLGANRLTTNCDIVCILSRFVYLAEKYLRYMGFVNMPVWRIGHY